MLLNSNSLYCSMWCHMDAIPAPDVEEPQGLLRLHRFRHVSFA